MIAAEKINVRFDDDMYLKIMFDNMCKVYLLLYKAVEDRGRSSA